MAVHNNYILSCASIKYCVVAITAAQVTDAKLTAMQLVIKWLKCFQSESTNIYQTAEYRKNYYDCDGTIVGHVISGLWSMVI